LSRSTTWPSSSCGWRWPTTRHEEVAAFERATGTKFRRVSIPRPVMALGGRLLRRRNPAIASVMGMSLSMDMTEVTFDDRPLRELGIEPRSTTEAIEEMVRSPSRTSDR
jgi:hypothetical protein